MDTEHDDALARLLRALGINLTDDQRAEVAALGVEEKQALRQTLEALHQTEEERRNERLAQWRQLGRESPRLRTRLKIDKKAWDRAGEEGRDALLGDPPEHPDAIAAARSTFLWTADVDQANTDMAASLNALADIGASPEEATRLFEINRDLRWKYNLRLPAFPSMLQELEEKWLKTGLSFDRKPTDDEDRGFIEEARDKRLGEGKKRRIALATAVVEHAGTDELRAIFREWLSLNGALWRRAAHARRQQREGSSDTFNESPTKPRGNKRRVKGRS